MFRASPKRPLLLLPLLGAVAVGCAPALPAPQAVASSPEPVAVPIVAMPIVVQKSDAAPSAEASTPAKEAPLGSIVIDDLPSDTAEIYEDDVPMTYDVGEAKPIAAGIHIVSLVVATKTVWASKITVVPGATVHVRIPPKYLTAYQD